MALQDSDSDGDGSDVDMDNASGYTPQTEMRPTRGRRPNQSQDEEDDEAVNAQVSQFDAIDEDSDVNMDDFGANHPDVRKRSRVNSQGDAMRIDHNTTRRQENEDEDDKDQAEHVIKDQSLMQRGALIRDADGYVPGSIIRIKLKNFLTYAGPVEFHPGPYLNMILGPNGNGKSSIASAIALGLGWNAKLLAKGKILKEFVKNGEEKGYVEIELKGRPNQPNVTIVRNISVTDNSSIWTMDGLNTTLSAVQKRVASLGIQANNLCSFLPQDKVGEFAQLTPQQLLVETQKAAGSASLTAWYEELKDLDSSRKNFATDITKDEAKLEELVELNRRVEDDVKRWQQKQEVQKKIDLWEIILPSIVYKEAKAEYDRVKAEKMVLKAKLDAIKSRNTPLVEKQKEQQENYNACLAARKRAEDESVKKFKQMQKQKRLREAKVEEIENCHDDIEKIRQDAKKRLEKIERLRRDLREAEEKAGVKPEVEDEAAINADRDALKAAYGPVEQKEVVWKTKADANLHLKNRLSQDITDAEKELRGLNNASNQRLDRLTHPKEKDMVETVRWLRKPGTAALFKNQVIEPAILSLEIRDPHFAAPIESCFSYNLQRTFVVTCDEDYRLLNRLINDETEALGRKARITVGYRPRDNSLSQPPFSPEQLQAFGFNGYAIDFMDGPEDLLWFLQKEAQFHRVAIALDGSRTDLTACINVLSAQGGGSFALGRQMYRVSRSAYGKRLPTTTDCLIHPAKSFGGDVADPERKMQLETMLVERRRELAEAEAETNLITTEEQQINEAKQPLSRREGEIKQRRERRNRALQAWEKAKLEIQKKQQTLVNSENRPDDSEKRMTTAKAKLVAAAKSQAKIMIELSELAVEMFHKQTDLTFHGLRTLQASANLQALEKLSKNIGRSAMKTQKAFEDIQAKFERIRADSTAKRDLAISTAHAARRELQEQMEKAREEGVMERTSDQARQELETLKADLDSIVVNDPAAIERYQMRLGEISELERLLASKHKQEKTALSSIQRVHNLWYPAIRDLVEGVGSKFSAAFNAIGCAGEIRLSEAEDYSQWCIEILVKFRERENLQLLTAQRQSGGERSLTTIMYLMSLTEYGRAPFSLVDEINQGMDSKAERVVHNQLVNVTCKEKAGQYFLITPKLLPNLNYHPRMKVLLVQNGIWLPDEPKFGNLKGLIQAYKVRHAIAA